MITVNHSLNASLVMIRVIALNSYDVTDSIRMTTYAGERKIRILMTSTLICMTYLTNKIKIAISNSPEKKLIFHRLVYEFLTKIVSSILMNCHQRGSCLPCETSTKEPMEIAVIIAKFNIEGIELVSLKALTTLARICD